MGGESSWNTLPEGEVWVRCGELGEVIFILFPLPDPSNSTEFNDWEKRFYLKSRADPDLAPAF